MNASPKDDGSMIPLQTRGDLQTLGQAIRQHWPLTDRMREAAVTRLAMILADSEQGPRMHLGAIRVMAELDKANAAHEANQIAREAPAAQTVVNVTTTVDVSALRRMNDEQLRELLGARGSPPIPGLDAMEEDDGAL
jgi:hypothetical protein